MAGADPGTYRSLALLSLMAAALEGRGGPDPGLRERLWEQHRYLLSFLRCRCRDEEEAEDILQESYLAFLASMGRWSDGKGPVFGGERKLRNYLVSIALNKLRDRRRGKDAPARRLEFRSPEEAQAWLDSLPAREASQDEVLAARAEEGERRALVALAMESISAEHRRVLELRFARGLANPEAARELGLGIKALESLLFRAKAAFKKAFIEISAANGNGADDVDNHRGGRR